MISAAGNFLFHRVLEFLRQYNVQCEILSQCSRFHNTSAATAILLVISGSNVGNLGGIHSETREWINREHSILIHLPPLATVALKLKK